MKKKDFSNFIFLALLYYVAILSQDVNSYMLNNNPYHRLEILDQEGKYQLEWLVDLDSQNITFNVTAETKGFVGFGLSKDGRMRGADMVIGGVFPNGTSYFGDYYSSDYKFPVKDLSQDYEFHSISENETHTFLSFSRKLDTCDKRDIPITEDGLLVIWAIGNHDGDNVYHQETKGSFNVKLLRPDYAPKIEIDDDTENVLVNGEVDPDLKVWRVPRAMMSPVNDTSYWCTLHAAPKLETKHHLVGFLGRYADKESENSVHHIQINKCHAPSGTSAKTFFSPYLDHPGQNCYNFHSPEGPIPTDHCQEIYHGQAFSGRALFNPPQVGMAFGENPDEFYIIQVHYDNPEVRSDLLVNLTLEFYYTSKLREHEGAFMAIGHIFPGEPMSLLVPPSSSGHTIRGHCSPDCTKGIIPEEGIYMFAMLLHAHNSARKMKLQHFRGNKELSSIASDDNYLFSFQQFKVLHKPVKILPGDQLITSCLYDNTWTNTTTVGGFSSKQEMCVSMTLYYNRITDYSGCVSQIDSAEARLHFLGVKNVTWSNERKEFVVLSPPEHLEGMTISEVADAVKWTPELRDEVQQFHLMEPHNTICLRHRELSKPNATDFMALQTKVGYPTETEEIVPPKESCSQ